MGQRTQKQDGTQHAFLKKSCGVGSCALHKIDVRSFLKHHAYWWYQGPQFTTACCVSYVYILLVAISANVINSIPSFKSLFFPGFSFSLLRRRGSEDEAWTDRAPCEMKTERRRELTKRAWKRRYKDDRWWMIMKNETWWKMGKDFSVQKLLCVKATVCKRVCAYKFFVQKILCVKFFWWKNFSV